jgi:hypothetical protein
LEEKIMNLLFNKITFIILIAILLLVGFTILASNFDVEKIQANNLPIFSIQKAYYRDGGTIEYIGCGYQIIKFHRLGSSGFSVVYLCVVIVPY